MTTIFPIVADSLLGIAVAGFLSVIGLVYFIKHEAHRRSGSHGVDPRSGIGGPPSAGWRSMSDDDTGTIGNLDRPIAEPAGILTRAR